MATPGQIDAVIANYGRQQAAVRERILQLVTLRWGRLESYRPEDIDGLVEAILPALQAGLVQVATITDGYLAAIEAVVLGQAVKPVGVPRAAVSHPAMRGIDAASVYRRAGQQVWFELSKGADIEQAAARGLDRLQRTVDTDLQLAKTHTARYVMEGKGNIVGYRRVLTGRENCQLCRLVSTQRYRTGELLPIHARCDCDVRPIFGTQDPGRVIDPDLLAEIKREQQAKNAPKPTVHQHGEVGPQLVDGRQSTKPRSELTPSARRRAERSAELRERWAENLAAARANGGLIEVDPKTLAPIVRAA